MEKITADSPEAQSASPIHDNLEALKRLFPSVVRDGQIDVDALRQLVGEDVVQDREIFGLNWKGKAESRRAALTPSLGTLRPCKEESVDWDNTKNLYIEGDNLEVLKLLRKSYGGKVKMIYIDPPYNTGKDFVYEDDYTASVANYLKHTNQAELYKSNTESDGRFHTKWLNMMYPRILLARDLLCDDGLMFVSLDNSEFANFKNIADEIFGYESFVTVIHVQMSTVQGEKIKSAKLGNVVKNAEYILVYSKNGRKSIACNLLYDPVKYDNHYQKYLIPISEDTYKLENLTNIIAKEEELLNELKALKLTNQRGQFAAASIQKAYLLSESFRNFVKEKAKWIVRKHDSIDVPDQFWKKMENGIVYTYRNEARSYLVQKENNSVSQFIPLSEKLRQADDFDSTYGPTTIRGDWWSGFYLDMGNITNEGAVVFKNGKKPLRLIEQLLYMTTKRGDVVMDFFSGSATTAHAVMQLNSKDELNYSNTQGRRFIMVQLPELLALDNTSDLSAKKAIKETISFLESIGKPLNLCEVGKERLRRAGAVVKEMNRAVDVGFRVYKLDSSNVKAWNPNSQNLVDAMNSFAEHLVANRTSEDFLAEIMLKSGIDLVEDAEEREIAGHRVYSFGFGQYYACTEDSLAECAEDLALGIVAWHEEQCRTAGAEPKDLCTVFVIDKAFNDDDKAKMNFIAILDQHGISSVKAL